MHRLYVEPDADFKLQKKRLENSVDHMTAILMCLQKMLIVDKNIVTKFSLRTIFIRDADSRFSRALSLLRKGNARVAWLFLTISHAANGVYVRRNGENVLVSRSRQRQLPQHG